METQPLSSPRREEDPQQHVGWLILGILLGIASGVGVALVSGFVLFAVVYGRAINGVPIVLGTASVVGVILWGLIRWFRRDLSSFNRGFAIGLIISTLIGGTCVSLIFGGG